MSLLTLLTKYTHLIHFNNFKQIYLNPLDKMQEANALIGSHSNIVISSFRTLLRLSGLQYVPTLKNHMGLFVFKGLICHLFVFQI